MYYRIKRLGRDEPNVDLLESVRVPAGHSPVEIDDTFHASQQSLAELGFRFEDWFLLNDQVNGGVACLAAFRHESGAALARHWRRSGPGTNQLVEPAQLIFVSAFEDGTFLVSTSSLSDMATPPGIAINQLIGADPMELWRSHLQKLTSEPHKQVRRMTSWQEGSAVLQQHHAAVCDFYLTHGEFEVPDPRESAAVAEVVQPPEASEYAPILAEIERLQEKRPGWGNAIFILGFSLLVFFGAGAAAWSWRFVVMLLPILLFHEFGHYIAMRVFGYRDLRMFFIPLFGAAVSGRHYNVPGWKKVIVSFAGPIPGIAIGIVIGITAAVANQSWLLEASMLMLVLNGFNLLPFLPLDGGWVAHAILFSRHPALDAGFRVVAAVALIAGGLALGTWILALVGVFMLFGVPMAFRIARVAINVRRENIGADADGDRIPVDAACRIIGELRGAIPTALTPKQMAQTTLQVFENANARPPGWLLSLGFGVVHAGCFLLVLVFLAVLAIQQRGGLGNLLDPLAQIQTFPFDVQQIRGGEFPNAEWSTDDAQTTVVATFPTRDAAERAFDATSDQASGSTRLMLFGQTVLVDFPEEDRQSQGSVLNQFRSQDAEVFVSREPFDSAFTLECVAPDERVAEAIKGLSDRYFRVPWEMYAIPPWSPEFSLSDQHTKARRTYQRLIRGPNLRDDEALQTLSEQVDEEYDAYERSGERDQRIRRLEEQIEQRESELSEQFRDQLRDEGEEQVDIALVDLYERLPKYETVAGASQEEGAKATEDYSERMRQWRLEVGARLGQLPIEDGRPQPGAARYSATCYLQRKDLRLTFSELRFARIFDGPQALAQWLHSQGCTDFQYGIMGTGEED